MIINLKDLKKKPCFRYLRHFDDKGNIDVMEVFQDEGEQWEWLLKNIKDHSLIDWSEFDWKWCSDAVAMYCPEYFDASKYDWENHSLYVAQYAPQHFDSRKYNWEKSSWAVAQYSVQHFDADKFNWEDDSYAVAKYCPELMKLKPKNTTK